MSQYRHKPKRRVWKTRAQEERENREADDRYRRARQEEDDRNCAAFQAQWDALTPAEQAATAARSERIRAAMDAEAAANRAWREQKDRERNEPFSTLGT